MEQNEQWLKWAVELQALAQAGLYYTKDCYDKERFQRIREIAAEMVSLKTDISPEKVTELFCSEVGYQTPKLDTRAAVFKDGKILLVKENNARWSLPGGWCDVDISVKTNAEKEVWEESGLRVTADSIIAVQERDKHNYPIQAFKICKIFFLCTLLGGEFKANNETVASGFFALDELPELSNDKNTREQIAMCFEANNSENWKTMFD